MTNRQTDTVVNSPCFLRIYDSTSPEISCDSTTLRVDMSQELRYFLSDDDPVTIGLSDSEYRRKVRFSYAGMSLFLSLYLSPSCHVFLSMVYPSFSLSFHPSSNFSLIQPTCGRESELSENRLGQGEMGECRRNLVSLTHFIYILRLKGQ